MAFKLSWFTSLCILVFLFSYSSLAEARVKVGDTFPSFSLEQIRSSQKVDLKSFKGSVVLIDFWASWCAPCKKAFPFYDQLLKRANKAGTSTKFVVLGINVDDEKQAGLSFLKENPVSFTNLFDKARKLTGELNVSVMPTSYLIDPNGRVVDIHEGFKDKDKPKLEAKVTSLLKMGAQKKQTEIEK